LVRFMACGRDQFGPLLDLGACVHPKNATGRNPRHPQAPPRPKTGARCTPARFLLEHSPRASNATPHVATSPKAHPTRHWPGLPEQPRPERRSTPDAATSAESDCESCPTLCGFRSAEAVEAPSRPSGRSSLSFEVNPHLHVGCRFNTKPVLAKIALARPMPAVPTFLPFLEDFEHRKPFTSP
jgi:hypothetical protein